MKRFFGFFLSIMVASAIIMSCEGPAGPKGDTGTTGTDGKDGKDASISCQECHGNDEVSFKFAQYDLSKHNKGIIYEEEAGRLSCGVCHSGDGFAESVASGDYLTATTKATSKINCTACHKIHTNFEYADFALRVTEPITLRKPAGTVVDFKTGNLCARCHSARPYNDVVSADTVFKHKNPSTNTYTRFGPHYGTPGNVFSMKGLYNVAGSLSVPSNNIHANLAKGCVSCHMGSNPTNPAAGGHTFLMTPSQMTAIAECKSCHPDPEVFTQLTKSNEIKAALKEYRTLLINKGFLDTTQAITADGYQILGEYFKQTNEGVNMTKEEVEVTLNYLYLAKDRSNGAHNPNYMYALVKNGVEFLKK